MFEKRDFVNILLHSIRSRSLMGEILQSRNSRAVMILPPNYSVQTQTREIIVALSER